jgi:hypothetical protein
MRPLSKDLFKIKAMKIIFMVLGLIAIMFILVYARTFYGSMRAYYKGENCLNEKKYVSAITFFDRSIHWYTPFNPYVERSAKRLWNIGKHAEKKKDIKLALIAFRTIRGGFYSTDSFYKPGREWIKKCDTQINKLMQVELQRNGMPISPKVKGRFLTDQKKDPSPSIFWTMFLEVGLLGWIGSVIGFILFVLRKNGDSRYSISSSLVWITMTTVFFALWIIGMMRA